MKKGYIKLFVFELIILILLILNSFIYNIFSNYNMVIFLTILIILFKCLFGFEKDKHRYTKDIIFEIIIFLFVFFILYYLFGLFIGFAKTDNYYTYHGFINFIIPTVLLIILREFLRYLVIMKSEGSKMLLVMSFLLFLFLDISNSIYYSSFLTKYDIFLFIALVFLPSISSNFLGNYLSYKIGHKPNIVYFLFIGLYQYLLPIVPNPNEYLVSVIMFGLPILLIGKLRLFFNESIDYEIDRNYKKKSSCALIIPTFIIIILVYFTSGYFTYSSLAIASGSMEKVLSKGDVVIIKNIFNNYDVLKEGQIIAYKYENVIVVHRIIKILDEKDKKYIYTKGDANLQPDNYVVLEENVIGIVKFKIPFIGLPTVWLNNI